MANIYKHYVKYQVACTLLGLLAWLAPLVAAAAEPRIALILGNGRYATGPLDNPPRDAQLMSDTLAALNFTVIMRRDGDQVTMKRAIQEFGRRLEQAGPSAVGLFYYAGHGVQINGRNYLVPVDARLERDSDVEIEAVSADWVLEQMRYARNRVNIIILDACRNNPFARSMRSADRGLARMDAPAGVLIAYSTAPGDVAADGTGRNSPYTQALARLMRSSNEPAELMFKQVRDDVMRATADRQTPWEATSLRGQNFYFTTAGGAVPPRPAVAAPLPSVSAPAAPAPRETSVCDLPVGRWKATGNMIAIEGEIRVLADRTQEWWRDPKDKLPAVTGTWSCEPEQRRFVFSWAHGAIDTVTMSRDGQTMTGRNQFGHQLVERRLR